MRAPGATKTWERVRRETAPERTTTRSATLPSAPAAARGESGPPSSHSPSLEPLSVSPPAASAASTRASAEVSTELRSLPPEPGDRPSCPLSRERSCPLSRERS